MCLKLRLQFVVNPSDPRSINRQIVGKIRRERLLLFLSVDLENSTQLKQVQGRRRDNDWLPVILTFIEDFPEKLRAKASELDLRAPTVWKLLGDEIVFVVELKDGREPAAYLHALRESVREWNSRVREKSRNDYTQLPVKGSAWIAEFPVVNTVVPISDGQEDYVGPSMDAGFRISRLATVRRLSISAELAWLTIKSIPLCKKLPRPIDIYFDGRLSIKGIAEGIGYPNLWIEITASAFHDGEHQVLGRKQKNYQSQIKKLCGNYVKEYGVPDYMPFIPGAEKFTPRPKEYIKDLKAARGAIDARYPDAGNAAVGKSEPQSTDQAALENLLFKLLQKKLGEDFDQN